MQISAYNVDLTYTPHLALIYGCLDFKKNPHFSSNVFSLMFYIRYNYYDFQVFLI